MRTLLLIPFIFCTTTSLAKGISSDAKAKEILAWQHQCAKDADECWLEKIVDFKSNKGIEQAGVAVAYDKAKQQPKFISIMIPADSQEDSEVTIRFLDSVQIDGKWTLKPVGDDFIQLPISGCDEKLCQARIYPQIPDGPSLFEEIKAHNHLWILFIRNGQPERIMVPVSGIHDEIEKISNEI